MLGLMFFVVIGIGAFVIADLSDGTNSDSVDETDSEGTTPDQTIVTGDDGDNVVISSDFSLILDQVATAANVDDSELEEFENSTIIAKGPLNVTTADGDDIVFASGEDDRIDTGDGDDVVLAGAGDDYVDLGDGDDWMAYAGGNIDANSGSLGALDAGDDEVYGRKGDDFIVDVLGSNMLSGNEGNDYIESLDAEGNGVVTPDKVFGGWNEDTLRVDEGDTVTTGPGYDTIIADLDFARSVEEGYQAITITDFTLGRDVLTLKGTNGLFEDIDPETDMTVRNLPDGTGTIIEILGIEVVRIEGVKDFDRGDIIIGNNS